MSTPINSNEEILTLVEVAALLKISQITARRWCKSGKIPAIKIGNHYRIRRLDIDKLFDKYAFRDTTIFEPKANQA